MTAEDRVNDRHSWTAETSPLSRALAHRRQQVRTGAVPVRAPRPVAIRPAKVVPGRRSLPCIHEGAVLEWCTCNDEARHVRDCDKHERCTRGPGKLRSCATCSDYDSGTGSPLVFHIAAGIGDSVSVLYAACGLADATGRRVDLHSNHPTWLAGVEHPGVRILSGKAGYDAHRGYDQQLDLAARRAVASRSQWYADMLAQHFGLPKFEPRLPASVARPAPVLDGSYVALSPFSNWTGREWPIDRWRELAAHLVADGNRVVVLGTNSDAPRMKAAFAGVDVETYAGKPVAWVVSLLANARKFIGNDSGMAHVAALHGTPTYTVQSHLLPEFVFAPARVQGIAPDPATWPCSGCGWRKVRGYSKAKCDKGCLALLSIGTDRVRDAVLAPRIGIVTGATPGYLGAHGAVLRESVERYAARHGCGYHWCDGFDADRPPAWSKIKFMEQHALRYDYLIWVDADVYAFEDGEDPLRLFDGISDEHHIAVSTDSNGICTGVFGMKVGPGTVPFLQRVWGMTEFIHAGWWEQRAIMEIQKSEPQRFHSIEKAIWNAYPPDPRQKVFRRGTPGVGDRTARTAFLHFPGPLKEDVARHLSLPRVRV